MIIAAFVAFFGFNCEDDSNPLKESSQPETITPEDSATFYEALVMSLWYTDNLYPDSSIAWRFYNNLMELRGTYADSIPEVNIEFVCRYEERFLYIGLDSSGLWKIRNNQFFELDSINDFYAAIEVDTSNLTRFGSLVVVYKNPINIPRLESEYESLPGISFAQFSTGPGDWSNIYPWIYRGKVTFLVRKTIGIDCPAGCPGGDFYYFMETYSGMDYVGYYRVTGMNDGPPPEWWNYGRTAYYVYTGYTIWRP